MNWLPIETAPENKPVDLWADGKRYPNVIQLSGGWYYTAGPYGHRVANPSHWMPIPDAPAPKGDLLRWRGTFHIP